MAPSDYSTRKELFARAFRDFIDAHDRGMRSLKARDFDGLHDAVADESAAVERASAVISDTLGVPDPASGVAPRGGTGPDLSLEAEHARLANHMRVLEREHRDLEARGDDLDAHREHRARLHAHIVELRVHLQRLRDEGHQRAQ